jgi:hypothetical protein
MNQNTQNSTFNELEINHLFPYVKFLQILSQKIGKDAGKKRIDKDERS